MMTDAYPDTRRDNSVVDDFHGTKVTDHYRWLEDPDSEETRQWVDAQNKITDSVLARCPNREDIFNRLKELQNYPKFGVPSKRGDSYYFWKNDGLQNQSVLYRQQTLTSEPELFLDPNKWSEDGTVSIGVTSFSESGKYLAYAVHQSGSDWKIINVKDTTTGEVLSDKLEWVKFSGIAWTHDDKGFYYCRYPAPKLFEGSDQTQKAGTETEKVGKQKVYYHSLGTPQSQDKLIYYVDDQPEWMYGVSVSEDGRYFMLTISESCERVNRLYILDLQLEPKMNGDIVVMDKIIDNFQAEYEYITNDGPLFYLLTNLEAPRKRLITIDITSDKKESKEIIPHKKNVLQYIMPVNKDKFVVSYLQDVQEVLELYSMTGQQLETFALPTIGTIEAMSGKRNHTEFFFKFVSFLHPGTIFHYDFAQEKLIVFREATVKGFNPDEFQTEQIFYNSKDGTKIPMFVCSKKGSQKNGQTPVLLYGYGGFNISITPSFSVSRVVWMQHYEAIYAVANIRGGDEYGEEWHQGGIKDRKQNVFDDFQAAAETLIKEGYTTPKKIGIMGGSNGGLLVAACVNQRPDLFGCGIAQVGVLDMLRFHKFTIGYAWCSDYGCADNAADFEYLYKYSPLHTVKKGKEFPSLLLTTGDHDDRVVPAHSFKYISEVQYQLGKEEYQHNPLVIRIEVKAGHGHGKPMEKILRESADVFSFLAWSLKTSFKA
eukprot:TRINITY_DN841_c0_g4_i1.p1 TRINITY_DN841_c0_g4~~TRINITY_DN841_c0_g4_i1.p1  ORF type:complete len:710 (-),score=195.27 TRINITY_DN841_c0_g4_i1:43-2172(-)